MGDVMKFPTRTPTPDIAADVRALFSAAPLTRTELLTGPLKAIRSMGPWVAAPRSELNAQLERANAIVQGLIGPGRVPLRDGLEVVQLIVAELLRGVPE